MKKSLFISLFALFSLGIFAQQLPTVAVATFDVMGGITRDEALVITELFMTELVAKRSVNVIDRASFDKILAEMKFQSSDWSNTQKTAQLGEALNADYIIRGQIMKMGSSTYWTATMVDVRTTQVLYSAREQLRDLDEVFAKLPTFCNQMLDKLPPPNYFIGRWQGNYDSLICILEFMADGTIWVERFDSEFVGSTSSQSDKATSEGSGLYSYEVKKSYSSDGSIKINLTLKDSALIYKKSINIDGSYQFTDNKNSFTLFKRIDCYDSVYSSSGGGYRTFIRLQD